MKVFVSWSKEPSKKIAEEVKHFVEMILPHTSVWMSEVDIGKGQRWSGEIANQLETTNLGIVCCTENNILEPWLHFEAGALSKSVSEGMVFPICFGVDFGKLPQTLAQFQATKFDRADILRLIHAINSKSENPIAGLALDEKFKRAWVGFELAINEEVGRIEAKPPREQEKLKKAALGPALEPAAKQILVTEDEIAVIRFLAKAGSKHSSSIIAANLRIPEIKAEVIAEGLRKKKLVERLYTVMGENPFYLTIEGKTFAVERGLI